MTGRIKGSWKICNLVGWEKVFPSEDSPEALAWMRNRDSKPTETEKELAKERRAEEREERQANTLKRSARKAAEKLIPEKIDDAIAYSMDGGDPIDCIGHWMDRTGITIEDIDKVANKVHNTKGGLYAVLADTWDEMERDGHIMNEASNPWRTQ